jgi:hypothetical protein
VGEFGHGMHSGDFILYLDCNGDLSRVDGW